MNTLSPGSADPTLPAPLRLFYATLNFPARNIVTVRVDSGYSVDEDMAADTHRQIYQHLGCDYGMIVDRAHDYSITPVPIFQFFNSWNPLRAIAIVTHSTMSKTMAEIDQGLSRKPLANFDDMISALTWINTQLTDDEKPIGE